jgi:putative Holliday junction resolvase
VTEAAERGVYPQGVKLGVDVGTVRVGVAVCDRDSILATPLRTLERNAKKNTDVRILAALAVELGAVEIFVGLPRTMKGEEHASARMATDYATLLAGALRDSGSEVPVRLVDERLSTVTAHRNLREAGMSSRDHRKVVDQVAAAGILQHAIDMQKARGTEIGSRVYAESAAGPAGNGADAGPAEDRRAEDGPAAQRQQHNRDQHNRDQHNMEGYSEPGQQ